MCNQFWIISNYLADCIENNDKFSVWFPDFDLMKFNKLYKSKYISFPLFPKVLVQFFGYQKYSRFVKAIFNNPVSLRLANFIINLLPNTKFVILDTSSKKSKYRNKHLKTIMDYFYPSEVYLHEINNLLVKKNDIDLIIGIHIRRGDYRNFNAGKYFYSFEDYSSIMEKINQIFKQNNVSFFIASNEKIDRSLFKNFDVLYLEHSNSITDLIGLSKCDYICGPPSTYSAWASLYQNKSIYFLENLNEEIFENSFVDVRENWF